jgi:hypothetical protein
MPEENGGSGSGDRISGSYRVETEGELSGDSHTEHHKGWDKSLDDALRNIPDSWRGKSVRVTHRAKITSNPGTIGEYVTDLTQGT